MQYILLIINENVVSAPKKKNDQDAFAKLGKHCAVSRRVRVIFCLHAIKSRRERGRENNSVYFSILVQAVERWVRWTN